MLIADPLYGYIEVPEEFRDILDSWTVQRLRHIKQLAFAHLVYPSANHTRFEHSLGTMHLAGIMAESIGVDKKFYMLCGLLHDVGHGPYSHAFEEVLIDVAGKTHESLAEKRIREIKDLISELGYKWRDILKEIKGDGLGIVSSELDSDRLDYLQRDAYHTGNALGNIQFWYVVRNAVLYDGKIAFKEKALYNIENILIARSLMYKTVYIHKTVVAASLIFERAMHELLDKGYDIEYLAELTDYELAALMEKENVGYWKRIMTRDLPKLLLEVPIHLLQDTSKDTINEIKEEVEKRIGVEVYIYPKSFREKRRLHRIIIVTSKGPIPLSRISKIGPYIMYLERSAFSLRIYVDKKYRNEENKKAAVEVVRNYLKPESESLI